MPPGSLSAYRSIYISPTNMILYVNSRNQTCNLLEYMSVSYQLYQYFLAKKVLFNWEHKQRMETETGDAHQVSSKEEEDIRRRSKNRSMEGSKPMDVSHEKEADLGKENDMAVKMSHKGSVTGTGQNSRACAEDFMVPWEASDDDVIEEGNGVTWFEIGMTREDKLEARKPWRNSLVIKVVGRFMGYHYLWRRIQVMWRTQMEPILNDLENEFFIT